MRFLPSANVAFEAGRGAIYCLTRPLAYHSGTEPWPTYVYIGPWIEQSPWLTLAHTTEDEAQLT